MSCGQPDWGWPAATKFNFVGDVIFMVMLLSIVLLVLEMGKEKGNGKELIKKGKGLIRKGGGMNRKG